MAVFRIEKTRDYTVMANHHLRNTALSLKAKGLLSLMLSLPEDWDYTTKGLARICRDGVDSICATVRELEDAGYIIRERVRNANGRLGSIEYTILEQPRPPEPKPGKPERENPVQVKPVLDAPALGKPEQEKPAQLNTKVSSKQSYFDDDAIVLLESMQDGILYSYILLKLYLKSLKHGGRLQLDESIPYTPQMIATITRQQIGTVERAIKIFLQLGLMEQMADGAFYMSNIELLIGQSSTEGERKRRARQANRTALNPSGQMSAHCLDIRPPEIEIELEIEKEIERELEKGHPSLAALGRYQNVFLSDTELSELQTDFPNLWKEYIERLSEYMASTGKTYKSHAATIRRWVADDRRKGKGGISDYSCKEGESL